MMDEGRRFLTKVSIECNNSARLSEIQQCTGAMQPIPSMHVATVTAGSVI